jgi:hypothetical protein
MAALLRALLLCAAAAAAAALGIGAERDGSGIPQSAPNVWGGPAARYVVA